MTGPKNDTTTDAWLIGTWHVMRSEAPIEIQPGTRMHFGADGNLEYAIPTGGQILSVVLRWNLDGEMLRSVHTDGSNPVAVRVSRGEADVLTFDFDGPRAWFVRAH